MATDVEEDYRQEKKRNVNTQKTDSFSPSLIRGFYKKVAQRIVDDFAPETVLDVGCANGMLVAELRTLGVGAYGIDHSLDSISKVPEDTLAFCAVCTIQETMPTAFPKQFDLVIAIEAFGHLCEEELAASIAALCNYSKTVLFALSKGIAGVTQSNSQLRYWIEKFAENGFFKRFDYDTAFVSKDAILFYRNDSIANVVGEYEQKCRLLETKYAEARDELYPCKISEERWQKKYERIANSTTWRATKPIRTLLRPLRKAMSGNRLAYTLGKGFQSLLRHGLKATWRKVRAYLTNKKHSQFWTLPDAKELEAQRKTPLPQSIKISIICPLYNTPKRFLTEMIASVQSQTYDNWELCLADGSDEAHRYVGATCMKAAARDKRLRYLKLESNLGIAGNSNAAVSLATGEYFGLLDHDDLLHPSALFEVMSAICNQNADLLYTDEAIFEKKPSDSPMSSLKPGYAPDNLRAINYICHFLVFARELMDRAGGGFRSGFDGSQDHELVLRLTEHASRIAHIQKVLYFWRAHKNSAASSNEAKPYAVAAGIKAVSEHLNRQGLIGQVENVMNQSIYRVRYKLEDNPLISVIILNKDHTDVLARCLQSIILKTSYTNYEIIIVENNSTLPKTYAYYESLNNSNIRVLYYAGVFNYSAINNFAARHAKGEYFLFLNNDIEVISEQWMEEMLMYAQRQDIGAVGAMLYYPYECIQHAGGCLDTACFARHIHYRFPRGDVGYIRRLLYANNVSIVTGACLLTRKAVFEEVGGFDEELVVAYNDVDLCLKIRAAGYLNVWTPFAELYHYESLTRGYDLTSQKKAVALREVTLCETRWAKELEAGDPFHNALIL